jgi:hypothetical protein
MRTKLLDRILRGTSDADIPFDSSVAFFGSLALTSGSRGAIISSAKRA